MTGVIWTQTIADIFNVIISYLIYRNCMKRFFPSEQ